MPALATLPVDPAGYRPHPLHAGDRSWPETNCYTDLWIEVLASLGFAPEAMLGFTAAQDFEGDQFTFFKVPLEDLDALYGIRVAELAIFDRLDAHVMEQLGRGRLVLVELDGYWLPDTRGVSYRTGHTKTTVAITALDPAARRMSYFHNAGFFALDGADYDGLFGPPGALRDPAQLFPYVEFAKLDAARAGRHPVAAARDLLVRHLGRRPDRNPMRSYGEALERHLRDLAGRPPAYFHVYAFNTLRQFGANFSLLAAHLDWLGANGVGGLSAPSAAASRIAEGAKGMQFRLARAMARSRFEGLAPALDPIAQAWDEVMGGLDAAFASDTSRRAA